MLLERLTQAAREGTLLDLAGPEAFDARRPDVIWTPEREVTAASLIGLLTATEGVHPRGVRVRGARIVGDLDWEWQHLRVPLSLSDCALESPMRLDQASVTGLSLIRCRVPGLSAGQLRSSSGLRLSRSTFDDTVVLRDAVVEGDVALGGATITPSRRHQSAPVALDAHRLRLAGSLVLEHRFHALGTVNLSGAHIGGSLRGSGGHLENPGHNALTASDAQVLGNVHLSNGFRSQGRVTFNRTRIEGNLSCDGGTFENPDGDALAAERVSIGGALQMRGPFRSRGRVRLDGIRVGGNLDCSNGEFDSAGSSDCLQAAGSHIEGNVVLRGRFRATGRIDLDDARIGGALDCDGATLVNPTGQALRAMNLTAGGTVRFDDEDTTAHFSAEGSVCLNGARVRGSVVCAGGSFVSPDGPGGTALDLSDTEIDGSVWITQNATVRGILRLTRGRIRGDLSFRDSTLDGSFKGRGMRLAGNFSWARSPARPQRVDLRRASVGQIDDDESSWPRAGGLLIDGFTYDRLSTRAPGSPAQRLEWIRRQPGFVPESYQQLVAVYRRNGQLAEATVVAMAQQDDLRRRGDLHAPARLWNWFIGRSIGHGYRPARAAWALVAVYLVTFLVVWLGARSDAFLQTGDTAPVPSVTSSRCGPEYPCFVPAAYALESIVPILNLHQRDKWQPVSTTVADRALRDWLFLSTVLGYAGTTLLAAGLSGLARKT